MRIEPRLRTQRTAQVGLSNEPADQTAKIESIEHLTAVVYVLNARIADLEVSNAELRACLNLNPPPPIIGADWATVQQVAGRMDCSESNVRKLMAQCKIEWVKKAGRILINTHTLPSGRCESTS